MTEKNCLRLAPLKSAKIMLLVLMAIAVLLPISTRPAKAVVQYCDLAPENCYYGGDGRWYYMAPGSQVHKAYRAGKITLPDIVERHRKERECALHADNGSCRVGPVRRRHRR